MGVTVKLDIGKLESLIANLPADADKVCGIAALNIERRAKTVVPVDTGALRASIHTKKMQHLLWMVGDGVEYGLYVELGLETNPNYPKQPWLIPSTEAEKSAFEAAFKALFK